MATVTALADRVCQITRLATTSTERALVLAALNDAYQQSVADSECLSATHSASLTANDNLYDIGTSPFAITLLNKIRYITVSGDGTDNRLLERISEDEFRQLNIAGSVSGPVTKYAVLGINQIAFYATPGSGVTASVTYVKQAPTLVESGPAAGEETTPSAFPPAFHYQVLQNLATALALEYARRGSEAGFYHQQYGMGLSKLIAFVNEFGGYKIPVAFRPQPHGSARPAMRNSEY